MLIVIAVQMLVCLLLLLWTLKQKSGERFTGKAVWRFFLFGFLAYLTITAVGLFANLDKTAFWHLNPLLAGFLSAFLLAALLEEGFKYLFFRLAVGKCAEVVTWHDSVIAAVIFAVSFTVFEDIQFTVFGTTNVVVRALFPAHLLFQAVMGYYYGKAKACKKPFCHVLSFLVPVLLHTLFDMFIIGLKAAIGDIPLAGLTNETLLALPNYNLVVAMAFGAVLVLINTLIGLILMLRAIRKWNRTGQLQLPLRDVQS